MSPEEHAALVRRAFDAWNSGDFDMLKTVFDEDVVIIAPEGWPEGEVSRGSEAWINQAERLRSAWAEARIDVEDLRSGENCIAVLVRYVTRAEGMDAPFETLMAVAFFLRENKVVLGQYFWTFDEALKLVGLDEQP